MSSSSTVSHVSELSKLIATKNLDTRLWLRAEMVRLVDPMIDSLFLGLFISSSVRPGAQPFKQNSSRSTMSELCQLIEGEKETTNRLVRGQMDRLVNSLFLRLTNKALVNTEVSAFASVQPSPSNHQNDPHNASIARSGDDGEENGIDVDWNGNEDVLVGYDEDMAANDQIGDEDGDELDQEGEQSGDGQESSEDQISDDDDKTEIDDEEYEMEVGGEECRTVEDVQIETTLPHRNGKTRKIVRQSARHLKRKQTNPIQPKLSQPNRNLQCPQCHKSFDFNSHLQQHLRVHTGERPFQCDQCDKRFNQISNLNKHQLIHQNIKPFRCDQCDKQFTHKDTLEDHQRTHSGERPFKCNFCERSFAKRITRNRHEQAIHLHVKPYRCKQCGHTAAHRSAIIRHIRMVHFGLPQTIKEQRALNIADERDPRELIEKV